MSGCARGDWLVVDERGNMGVDGERGQIAPGFVADLVLLSPDLRVQTTIASGEVVYSAAA